MAIIYIKIFLLVRFLYRSWQYRVGSFSGANLQQFLIDFIYIVFAAYLFKYFENFTEKTLYVDILLGVSLVIYTISMALTLRLYFLSKNFGLKIEPRLIFFIDYFINKNNKEKGFKMLLAHRDVVKTSSPLLISLGECYQYQEKFQEAFDSFVEATEYTNKEELLILASTKAFHVCANELKNLESAKAFITAQVQRDISIKHMTELEKLIK